MASEALARTGDAISSPRLLPLDPYGRRPWSPDEDELISAVYPVGGASAVLRLLPHRTFHSLSHRVRRLQLVQRPHWTPSEDKLLIELWDQGSPMRNIIKETGRTRAACGIRAQQLGLKGGCPRGFEYLSASARRCGFSNPDHFRAVLRASGVSVKLALSKTEQSQWRRHIVEPEEADRAVAAWMLREPVAVAARRVGMAAHTMRRWLVELGEKPPGRRLLWRVTDAQVAKVVDARKRLSSVAEAARRNGTTPGTLRLRLREAGVSPPPYHGYWFVTEEEVAAAMKLARRKTRTA